MKLSGLPYEQRTPKDGEGLYVQYCDIDPILYKPQLAEQGIENPVVIEKGNLPRLELYAIIANKI